MKKIKLFVAVLLILITVQSFSFFANARTVERFNYRIEDYGVVLTEYLGNSDHVVVPKRIDGYRVIATEGTFRNNKNVGSVYFFEGIKEIGAYTFYGCENLHTVDIPDTVNNIGEYAFAFSGLWWIYLPKDVNIIEDGCFQNCQYLRELVSKSETLFIDHYAFYNSGIYVIETEAELDYEDDAFNSKWTLTKNYIQTETVIKFRQFVSDLKSVSDKPIIDSSFIFGSLFAAVIIIFAFLSLFGNAYLKRILVGKRLKLYKNSNNKFKKTVKFIGTSNYMKYTKPIILDDYLNYAFAFIKIVAIFYACFVISEIGIRIVGVNSLVLSLILRLVFSLIAYIAMKIIFSFVKKIINGANQSYKHVKKIRIRKLTRRLGYDK